MKQQLSNLQLIYQVFGGTWTWTFDVEHHMIVKRGLTAWELAHWLSVSKRAVVMVNRADLLNPSSPNHSPGDPR